MKTKQTKLEKKIRLILNPLLVVFLGLLIATFVSWLIFGPYTLPTSTFSLLTFLVTGTILGFVSAILLEE